jgi:hypothetical protein
VSHWLTWQPSQKFQEETPGYEPTKPTELGFEGFDGSVPKESPIIRAPKPASEKPEGGCPYPLPVGVKLLSYAPKNPPVAVTVCSVVTDVPKFIQHALGELDARLHHPVQIKAGDSVFDLLSKLADVGLELKLEWPPEGQIMSESSESKPSKPTKLAVDITDEDIPF